MNITGDNINTVKNTDDCTVLIRDTESPKTKTKISFKSHRNHKKTQFLVGLQADPHERTELPELYRSHVFPPRCPSVFLVADDTTYLIARVLT